MKVSSLTISIPAFNEEASIQTVINSALQIGPQVSEKFELLLVDDGSTDHTYDIMKNAAKQHPTITIVRHAENKGFSGAIKSCYKKARSEWIFLAPADGQVSMDVLPLFISKTKDVDVVVGFRNSNPEPITRKLNSFIFHMMYRLLFGVTLREISTAILWKKKILDQIEITALDRSALIQPEVIYKAWNMGAKFTDVGFRYHSRIGGFPKGGDPTMIVVTIKEMIRLYKDMKK